MTKPQVLPQKLLLTTDAIGGVWTYACELALGMAARGTKVALVVQGPPPAKHQAEAIAAVRGIDIVESGLDLEWRDRAALSPAMAERLRAIEAEFQPDIVHVNGFREAAAGWRVPVVLGAHSCVGSWWRACKGDDPPPDAWGDYLAGIRKGLDAAQAVLVPTKAFGRELVRIYGPIPSLRALPHGVALPQVPATARQKRFLAAGRMWDVAKNVAALEQIAAGLPWPVEIAGAPPEERNAASPAIWLGALDRTRLMRRMAETEIFVAPARYEPFGLAVLEAANAGCALVLGDVPTLRELWDGAAEFVDPDDPEALRQTLVRLASDPLQRRRLQAASRSKVRLFTRPRMVAGTLSLYRELLHGSTRISADAKGIEPQIPEIKVNA